MERWEDVGLFWPARFPCDFIISAREIYSWVEILDFEDSDVVLFKQNDNSTGTPAEARRDFGTG